ncbi:MAG: SURF1 family protein, partial [Pirellulales bacterium]|nr:SURF1 family protein [Pirellulales bacterium]
MKIKLLPTLFALVGVPVTFGLGIWQVQRHLEKMAAHEIVSTRMEEPLLTGEALLTPKDSDHWKMIELEGRFESKTALIGGKMEQNQPGYNLLQLFTTKQGASIIVERGWMPREHLDANYERAMTGIDAVTLQGQLRPIRFLYEMEPVAAPDFPTSVWRPASQGEIHRRWLPDTPAIYVIAGPALREHQSKDLTQMPYAGFVPTPAEYNSLL